MRPRSVTSDIILSAQQSGSNLLRRGLESTNLAGKLREYLSPEGTFCTRQEASADPMVPSQRGNSLGATLQSLIPEETTSPAPILVAIVRSRHAVGLGWLIPSGETPG